ncbi:MAG TPA: hypothetical protein VGH80_10305 [Xanthomonadaceae bacterium]|jgi:hypothetical protein
MELVFTKGNGKYDRMDVIRGDGVRESVDCPKQRIIPHDMVHFAVESVLCNRGFLRRVHEGEPANFRMAPDAETDAVERLVEVFQGDGWSGGNSPPDDMLDLYRVTCEARACPVLPIDASDIHAVRARIEELTAQWNAVDVGGTLRLAF